MTKLGSDKRPVILRVQSSQRAAQVAKLCNEHGLHYIIGVERDKPEDISDIDLALNAPPPAESTVINRNAPCPCGSGKKYKNCCGAPHLAAASN